MVSLGGSLNAAKELSALGLRVVPAKYKEKAPLVNWKKFQTADTSHMLDQWFGRGTERNFWIMTGHASHVIVIDADSAAGDTWWRTQIGDDVLDATAKVKTSKGYHYWFKIPDDFHEPIASWSVHPDTKAGDTFEESFDVRADGTGVIAPPSVHETGHVYVWETPFSAIAEAPPALLDGSYRAIAPSSARAGVTTRDGAGAVRSMLSSLLSAPPAAGGRNDWLARVAGHYARTYHQQHDLFMLHCGQANGLLTDPLPDLEFRKTVESIWRTEQDNHDERTLDADNGWLASGNTVMLTQVVVRGKDDDTRSYEVAEYADFDLLARGVDVEEGGRRSYWVTIRRKSRRQIGVIDEIDAVIPGSTLGDDRAFRKWLAGFACTILPPENLWPRSGSPGIRIQRYLESQKPSAVRIVPALGWDDAAIDGSGGFITHDGVITAGGVVGVEDAGVRPDPSLRSGGVAPHVHGYERDGMEAKRALDEVLSFHDATVTSVFGAWWAACLVKTQIEKRTALFPFVAVEAPSESGKTNGFFQMMIQLNGNTRGETVPTYAALRDMASAHKSGIVWVDDLDDPAHLMELLRAATSGGTLSKMGEDRTSIVNRQIVSPIVISGEALGLGSQKALLDRAIILKVGSPTGRMSRHAPGRPQWDDVIELRRQYPDGLSAVSGWLVQDALSVVDRVLVAIKGKKKGSGRAGDKIGILRAGACLLDYLLAQDEAASEAAWNGAGEHARRVDEWLFNEEEQALAQGENSLTLEILPWAIRTWKFADRPMAGQHGDLDTPVYIEGLDTSATRRLVQGILGEEQTAGAAIWFNTALLAQAWEKWKGNRVERRTQTESALKDQADVVCTGTSKTKRIVGASKNQVLRYRPITGTLAEAIIQRARG